MQSYTYATHSTNELDIEINNKRNEVQRLREEIKELELTKSKQDTNFVGRVFEMKGMEYIYVTGTSMSDGMYGISFDDYEGAMACIMDLENKVYEVSHRNCIELDVEIN